MKRMIGLAVLLLAVFLVLTGCSGSFSTAKISSAVLAKDAKADSYDPVDPTSVFATDQPVIHLVVAIKNAPSDTKLKSIWTAVDVGDAAPAGTVIDETEYTADGSGKVDFTLSQPSTGTWPVGTYKVDIYLDGKLDTTLEFTVE
jgi:hypothetical protein